MTKKELLKKIQQDELSRLDSLTLKEFKDEFSSWFQEDMKEGETRENATMDLLFDFMKYRECESEEELIKLIN